MAFENANRYSVRQYIVVTLANLNISTIIQPEFTRVLEF